MLWKGKVEEIHSEAKSVVTETFQKCCFRMPRNEQVAWFCTNCDEPHRRAAIQTDSSSRCREACVLSFWIWMLSAPCVGDQCQY